MWCFLFALFSLFCLCLSFLSSLERVILIQNFVSGDTLWWRSFPIPSVTFHYKLLQNCLRWFMHKLTIIKILILFPQRTWRPLSFDIFFQKFIMSTFFNLLLLLLAKDVAYTYFSLWTFKRWNWNKTLCQVSFPVSTWNWRGRERKCSSC